MRKSLLRDVHTEISNKIADHNYDKSYDLYYLQALDIIESKLYKPLQALKKKKLPKNICSIQFHNKAVEMINLANILRKPEILSSLPTLGPKFEIPMITYNLTNPIGHKIFNFHKFVDDLDVDAFLHNNESISCHCQNSPFSDSHHGHIVTGDLKIIENLKLRNLLLKGPKYRQPHDLDFKKAKEHILMGLKECVEKWCNDKGVQKNAFAEWFTVLEEKIDHKITDLLQNIIPHHNKISLSSPDVAKALEDLQNKYVITPIDKANGNIAIICKRFYASILIKELDIGSNNNNNPTYQQILDKYSDTIVRENINDLKKKFKINHISDENHCLPKIYWIPKKHKNPSKARFIIASPKCSIKPLSRALTSIFKLFYKQIEAYNLKCQYFSGVKSFWVVQFQNNQPVIEAIEKINRRSSASSISTFDFSTLYTKIPHDKLLFVLNSLTDFCFNGGENNFIEVSSYGAKWVKEDKGFGITLTKEDIKEALKYLLSNCYFTIGNKLFRQIIGIPMGSDPAPYFANLFLYYYENKWVCNLKRTDLMTARKLKNIFRFIDDLNAINDHEIFFNNINNIYPAELELGKENEHNNEATFLDLHIKIENCKFKTCLFDKRDNFKFDIVRMPHKSSNIPSNMFYNTISAESLRIVKASHTG